MSIIGDVLAALKATREWSDIAAAARKVPALEARIVALEAKMNGGTNACPSCGKPGWRIANSRKADGSFGLLGVNVRTWHCDACGFSEESMSE